MSLAFYLSNRSRAIWQTKPAADLSINLGLESLIAEVVRARDERAAKLVIDHGSTETPSAQHGETALPMAKSPRPCTKEP